MRVLLLSRYTRLGASSRLRSFQYLPYLAQSGFEVTISPLFDDDYVRELSIGRISKLGVMKAYWRRITSILKARNFDLVWLEKEMLPWIPAWIELALLPANKQLIVDYDDAIFHRYDEHGWRLVRKYLGRKIGALMKRADLVTVGNDYLAEYANQAGASRVELLPTVVDVGRYAVSTNIDTPFLTIGWVGQPSTAKYLIPLLPVLNKIIDKHRAHVVAIGPDPSQFARLPIEIKPWSEETEAADIAQFDIGIMPLANDAWEKGKCGYKLIQYMACGKPVVATPVGVNSVLVRNGENGFHASSESEWCDALDKLCQDAALRKRMGDAGRAMIEQDYSLDVIAPRLVNLLNSMVTS